MLFQNIYNLEWESCPNTSIVEGQLRFPQAIPLYIKPCVLVEIVNLIVVK